VCACVCACVCVFAHAPLLLLAVRTRVHACFMACATVQGQGQAFSCLCSFARLVTLSGLGTHAVSRRVMLITVTWVVSRRLGRPAHHTGVACILY